MGCLGVHFALTVDQVQRLRGFRRAADRLCYLQDQLEDHFFENDSTMVVESDKAWDAIHRALTDGDLSYMNGAFPLSHVILGGEILYNKGDYIMTLKTPCQVHEIAIAIQAIGRDELRHRYNQIPEQDYGMSLDDEDFDYTWTWFQALQAFYQRADAAGRYVLFTVDQ